MTTERRITGWHVLAGFVLAFGTIIAVNVTLAVKAVSTFPGLEVKNSYVASQSFDTRREAQQALGWDVTAGAEAGMVWISFTGADGAPVAPRLIEATLGRATHVQQDRQPEFAWDGTRYAAPAELAPGNWNIRLKAEAEDGTLFEQRIVLHAGG